MNTADGDDETETECPFCKSSGDCEHLLLVVDKTFRTAEGGILMNAFNERWSAMFDDAGEDFDEAEPFDELLEEVQALSDATADVEQEGAPGMSSNQAVYYVESERKAQDALTRFLVGSRR